MLTREDVIKTSQLARIKLTEEEIIKFTPQMAVIIDYINKLSKVDTSNVEPTLHTNEEVKNKYRKDEAKESLTIDEVLKNAPCKDGRYITTKAVL